METGKKETKTAAAIIPTRVNFYRGGSFEIQKDGSVLKDNKPWLLGRQVTHYDIECSLEPSGEVLHIHSGMSGVLHVQKNATLRSVLNTSVHPFLPQHTVASVFGTVTLDDGSEFSFDHNGRIFGLLETVLLPPLPDAAGQEIGQPKKALIDYAELRRCVSIRQVLNLISWRPVKAKGDQQRGPCPIHHSGSETSTIFSVNLKRNAFQCFKCGEKGNQLDLYVAVTGLPIYEAALDLCEKAGIEVPYQK